MSKEKRSYPQRVVADLFASLKRAWDMMRERGPSQIQFWFIALIVGIVSGFVALGFRKAIEVFQASVYGVSDVRLLHSYAEVLPWYIILLIPVSGGLAVGFLIHRYAVGGRVQNVADVIEGAALNNGRVSKRTGLVSAAASLITLSTGGSTGREGPVVHLAAVISSYVSNRLHANGITGRDLLGCAVAAAVSASFNAPIAGAIFALEVVLRHFAVHAFAPIVIASAAGTVINRIEYGNVTEFALAEEGLLRFYAELPAFVLLGLLSGLVAVVFMRTIFMTDDFANWAQQRIKLHPILRPAVAGLCLGGMAIWFPHIIGVGYETTSAALTGTLLLREAIIFTVLKVIAVAITTAGRMGGGVFSPALMIGAMTGLAFGMIATAVFPEVSGAVTLYALAGMGAVAAAVLGAPISTTLIVFELTGDWQTGLAVMVAISLSTAISSKLVNHSYFLTLLERRGVHLAAGPQAYLLATVKVGDCVRPQGAPRAASAEDIENLIVQGVYLTPTDTLEKAMPLFERSNFIFIPVITPNENDLPVIHGALFQVDALKVFSKKLSETAAEEHG